MEGALRGAAQRAHRASARWEEKFETIATWFEAGEPATIAHKVRIGRAAIGLALRQRNRGLANDDPLVTLADDLGYPDLEALLVAVAERRLIADDLVERMIAAVDRGPR